MTIRPTLLRLALLVLAAAALATTILHTLYPAPAAHVAAVHHGPRAAATHFVSLSGTLADTPTSRVILPTRDAFGPHPIYLTFTRTSTGFTLTGEDFSGVSEIHGIELTRSGSLLTPDGGNFVPFGSDWDGSVSITMDLSLGDTTSLTPTLS